MCLPVPCDPSTTTFASPCGQRTPSFLVEKSLPKRVPSSGTTLFCDRMAFWRGTRPFRTFSTPGESDGRRNIPRHLKFRSCSEIVGVWGRLTPAPFSSPAFSEPNPRPIREYLLVTTYSASRFQFRSPFQSSRDRARSSFAEENCATGCATEFALFAVSFRQDILGPSKKPAEIAGFSVKSLVALPGIEPGF